MVFAHENEDEQALRQGLRQGLRATEALLRTANNGLQAEFQRRDPVRLHQQGWKNVAALDVPDPIDITPHWQSMPQTAYLYAYAITGEQHYLDAVTRGLDHMIAKYPRIGVETSRTTAIARYLLPLAGAYEYTKNPQYKEILLKLADELEQWQDQETGAIRE